MKSTVSTRLLMHAATLINAGLNPRTAGHVAIAEALTDDPEISQSLKDLIDLSL